MTTETEIELLKAIKGLNQRLDENESDYCNSKQAIVILGLMEHQQIKYLVDKGFLGQYPRGNGFRYKKSECRKLAGIIDRGEIKIPVRVSCKKE